MSIQPHLVSCRRRALALGLVFGLAAGAASAIVTSDPATGGPPASDPHVVPPGPFDINDHVSLLPDWPAIDHDGVVEIAIEVEDLITGKTRVGTCSGAVVVTPPGPQGQTRGLLTAAHCVQSSRIVQIRTVVPVAGVPTQYTTCNALNDPGCPLRSGVFTHPDYRNRVNRGYDLALVYFEQPISPAATAYEVLPGSTDPLSLRFFVKFGFGCRGYGGSGVDTTDIGNPNLYDHRKRWAANVWEQQGLGIFGVDVCGGLTFTNNQTQLVYDFDNFTQVTNNLFNFYLNTFDPATGGIEVDNKAFAHGVPGGEGWACPGDSGGPNFVFDHTSSTWKIGGVTSYGFRMDDDWGPFSGNSDIDGPFPAACDRNMSFGEFGGDAAVNESLLGGIVAGGRAEAPPGSDEAHNGLGTSPAP